MQNLRGKAGVNVQMFGGVFGPPILRRAGTEKDVRTLEIIFRAADLPVDLLRSRLPGGKRRGVFLFGAFQQ